MGNPAGVKRNFDALEKRRMEAAKLLNKGFREAEVARRMGVHRQSVNRWARQLKESGITGLKKAGRAGRKPGLSKAELDNIREALEHRPPEVLGDESDRWTAGRLAKLIEREYGIQYHPGHAWKILHNLTTESPKTKRKSPRK
jgi:transposase